MFCAVHDLLEKFDNFVERNMCFINKEIDILFVFFVPSYILFAFCYSRMHVENLSRLSRIVNEMYHVPTIFGIFIIHPHPISLRKKKKCFYAQPIS